MRKNSHSLYLLSFTQTWALTRNVQFLQTKLKPYLLRMDLGDVVWILTPIHVNGNYWGLLCLNITQHQALYDDGLKQSPPTNIIELADNLRRLYQKPNGISPFQFSGLECPNSHYLEKVELVQWHLCDLGSLIS